MRAQQQSISEGHVSFFGAMTCKKSRRFCFFKYFFVRYLLSVLRFRFVLFS